MLFDYFSLAVFLGVASALPGGSDNWSGPSSPPSTWPSPPPSTWATAPGSSPTYTPSSTPSWGPMSPTYTTSWGSMYTPPLGGDCGSECGGVCGDGIVQPPEECDLGVVLNNTPGSGCDSTCHKVSCCGDGIVEPPEECDAGPLNGVYGSGCSKDCKFCGFCGDGIIDDAAGEQCDDGWQLNGTPGSNCSSTCQLEPVTCTCSCCYEGTATGPTQAQCEANCEAKCPSNGNNGTCQTCNPSPPLNFCDITTSCIVTPSNNDYCACRAGYRADGLAPTDPKQFRLAFPGQEYRVFVAPGVSCNTLCTNPFPGPISCQEVPVQDTC